ncbi:beta-taxilin isoform X2 [Fundulus heteroclitus]|uniref:beta-taxilin isoform X2 n=1 Tax=Fundulus heteroclitus TaxID=8078 RepID=UPI00165B28B4|nr:beta-taxilin isoform X2 [Fundulus heteroclitus]
METSVEAAELMVPAQPGQASSLQGGAAVTCASSDSFDPMEEFGRRLQDILRVHGSADGLQDKPQLSLDAETEKTTEEAKGDVETDISLISQSLDKLPSPEQKLEELVHRFSELAALRRRDAQRTGALQQKLCVLLEERQQLQAERRCSAAARSKLEALCRDLQAHYSAMREETLQRCREDEEKRKEITNHFQEMLTEIQAQIEQHSSRNDRLCQENTNLTHKLESLMSQYERREESLEKINKHQDLQHKLTEARLQQTNALLTEAEEKHKREKEYLLVQAAEWKLQAKTLTEQATVMQAQLTLYAQKFDEFQATLAKSNEIYVRFKKEMDNMTEKMKKVEKEANLWRTRFENCNKTLIDMIEERTEKGKEYDLFVLKIQKLEKLCHALQEERKGLYDKIREVRQSNANLPSMLSSFTENSEVPEEAAIPDLEGLQELQEEDPVLMENIARLREEQAKLQEFAASLLATPEGGEEQEEKNESDAGNDLVVSAIAQFQTRTEMKEDPVPVPAQVEEGKSPAAEPGFTQSAEDQMVQDPSVALLEAPEPHGTKSEPTEPAGVLEAGRVQTQVLVREEQLVQQSEPTKVEPEAEGAKVEPEAGALKTECLEETCEVKPVLPVEDMQVQPVSGPEQVPEKSTQPSEGSNKPAASSTKQVQKKKKKRNMKSSS